jgi:hypothetical protein
MRHAWKLRSMRVNLQRASELPEIRTCSCYVRHCKLTVVRTKPSLGDLQWPSFAPRLGQGRLVTDCTTRTNMLSRDVCTGVLRPPHHGLYCVELGTPRSRLAISRPSPPTRDSLSLFALSCREPSDVELDVTNQRAHRPRPGRRKKAAPESTGRAGA